MFDENVLCAEGAPSSFLETKHLVTIIVLLAVLLAISLTIITVLIKRKQQSKYTIWHNSYN